MVEHAQQHTLAGTAEQTPAPVTRERLHRRTIVIDGYRRSDGLWDIEGELHDVKAVDHGLKTYVHPANVPMHHMKLRITVDDTLTIRDAGAVTLAAPYNPECAAASQTYDNLKGVQIKAGFRAEVARRLGTGMGCTHISELLGSLATAAVQTTAGLLPANDEAPPLQLGSCYAYRESGALVREHYVKWYRPETPEPPI